MSDVLEVIPYQPSAPCVPPFLFRAASDQSRGLNILDRIDPLDGYDSKYHTDMIDFESTDLPTLRQMLYDHIRWTYKVASEFSSWSVSLLYVLAHAVRKTYSEDETNVIIYVMDTGKLPASRIHEAKHLLKKYDMLAWKHIDARAEGEYLIHGELINTDGLWKAVPLEQMITAGLWKAFPEMRNPYRQHLLQQRVKQLRFRYFHNITYGMQDFYLTILSQLAERFGTE